MNYLILMSIFFIIGLSSFGGGYAMIPMMSYFLVGHWINIEQFNNILAVSQATPGPFAVNMATFIGFTALGKPFLGALVTTTAIALPSFFLCIIAIKYYQQFKESGLIKLIMRSLRPTIGAFILWTAISIIKNEVWIGGDGFNPLFLVGSIQWQRLGLFFMLVALSLTYLKNRSITLIILGAIFALIAKL